MFRPTRTEASVLVRKCGDCFGLLSRMECGWHDLSRQRPDRTSMVESSIGSYGTGGEMLLGSSGIRRKMVSTADALTAFCGKMKGFLMDDAGRSPKDQLRQQVAWG